MKNINTASYYIVLLVNVDVFYKMLMFLGKNVDVFQINVDVF